MRVVGMMTLSRGCGSSATRRFHSTANVKEGDAVDERHAIADLVLREVENALLLFEAAGGDFGRVGVYRNCRQALGPRHVAQVTAEAALIDGKVLVERQQHGRNDAVRDVMGMSGHFRRSTLRPPSPRLARTYGHARPSFGGDGPSKDCSLYQVSTAKSATPQDIGLA